MKSISLTKYLCRLVLRFVLLILIGVTLASCSGIGGKKQNITPTEIPTLEGNPTVEIVETTSHTEVVDPEVQPLKNCGNPNSVDLDITRAKTVEHQTKLGGEVSGQTTIALPIPVIQFITFKIQSYYEVQDNVTDTRSYTVHLHAAPNSWADYTLNWKYSWQEGKITLTYEDGTTLTTPYQIRAVISFEIVNVEPKKCP